MQRCRIFTIAAIAAACAAPALAQGEFELDRDKAESQAKGMNNGDVVLLTKGKGESRQVRYVVREGNTSTYTTTQSTTTSQSMNGQQMPPNELPPIEYTFTSEVTDVTGEGPFTLKTTLAKAGVTGDGQMARMMGPSLKALEGAVTSITTNELGSIDDRDMEMPAGANAAPDQASQVADLITVVPLPKDPIAAGAVWRHKLERESGGITVVLLSTYTLEELNDNRLVLSVDVHQLIDEQKLENDQMPPGAEANVTDGYGKGSGTLTVDLASATVPEMEMGMDMDVTVAVSMQGQNFTTKQSVKTTMSTAPAEADDE